MTKQKQSLLIALIVFLALSAGLIAVTSRSRPTASEAEHTDHDHETPKTITAPCCPGDAAPQEADPTPAGHDRATESTPTTVVCADGCSHANGTQDLKAVLTAFCEHDMRTLDCGECRYEVGAAHIDPNLGQALLVTQEVTHAQRSGRHLVLTGEIELDLSRVVQVTSIGTGRVQRIDHYLGEHVESGALLAVLQSAELAQTQAQFIEAVAQRDLTEQTFRREEKLEKQQVTSQADYQAARAAQESAQVLVQAAEHRLRLYGMADEDIATLAQTRTPANVGELTLRAPRNGAIIDQSIVLGQLVEAGHPLYTLADLDEVWLWCDVYERDLQSLYNAKGDQASLTVTVTVSAYANTQFSGTLDLIDPRMNHSTRTVKVRVRVENPNSRLKPGMYAQATLNLGQASTALLVPATAVLKDEGQPFVFVRVEKDLWLRQNVLIGVTHDGLTEILGGLDTGQTIVVKGGFMFKSEVLKEKMGAGCAH